MSKSKEKFQKYCEGLLEGKSKRGIIFYDNFLYYLRENKQLSLKPDFDGIPRKQLIKIAEKVRERYLKNLRLKQRMAL